MPGQARWRGALQLLGLGLVLSAADMVGDMRRGVLPTPAQRRAMLRLRFVAVSLESGTQLVLQTYAALADGHLTLADRPLPSCAEWGGGAEGLSATLEKLGMKSEEVLRRRLPLLLSVAVGLLNVAWFAVAYEKEHRWAREWKDMGWRKWLHPAVATLFVFRLGEAFFRTVTLACAAYAVMAAACGAYQLDDANANATVLGVPAATWNAGVIALLVFPAACLALEAAAHLWRAARAGAPAAAAWGLDAWGMARRRHRVGAGHGTGLAEGWQRVGRGLAQGRVRGARRRGAAV